MSGDGKVPREGLEVRGTRVMTDVAAVEAAARPADRLPRLSGRWFYGGVMLPQFGHFLTESIHRLLRYGRRLNAFDGVLFIAVPYRKRRDYRIEDFPYIAWTLRDYLGLTVPVRLVQESCQIECLVVRPARSVLAAPTEPAYLSGQRQREAAYFGPQTPLAERDAKLFVSRANYLRMGRTLGMEAVEAVFAANGYDVYHPEKHALVDQIQKVRAARHIVYEAGSAIHVLDLLGPQQASVDVIARRGGREVEWWANHLAGRATSISGFSDVIPFTHYFGVPEGIACSLMDPWRFAHFMRSRKLDFSAEAFLKAHREAVPRDLAALGLGRLDRAR